MTAPDHDESTAMPSREDVIRRAIAVADPNALRIALYQLTGDPSLAVMRVVRTPTRGGASYASALAEEHHDEVARQATAHLLHPPAEAPPAPTEAELAAMIELFTGECLSREELRFALEELAIADFPREVVWEQPPAAETLARFHVVVIGAGISGLAAAIQLERLGIPYTVLERHDGIGGTWHVNDYPEARVDVNCHVYQFSFEKNYPWTELYPSQAEVKKYLEHVAVKYGVAHNVRLNVEATEAVWDEGSTRWLVTLRDGERRETLIANVVISASGLFGTPKIPDIDGIETFEGAMFHTAEWNHACELSGRRVALIGNGSSGTQLMPEIARRAERLFVFQRTPNWIGHADDHHRVVTDDMRWLSDNLPYYWNWFRFSNYIANIRAQHAQSYDRDWQALGGLISERNDALRAHLTDYLRTKVGVDTDLFERCLPDYPPLARRLVEDNGWYDALRRDDVELMTDGIDRITSAGVDVTSGRHVDVDVVILATGFEVSRYLWPMKYRGRGGRALEGCWRDDGARAHLGMVMPGFPNLFVFYGPNGQPRAGGFHSWAEVWARYTVKAITMLIETGVRSMECREEVCEDYNRRLDDALDDLIWQEGAGGYYINEFGRIGVQMPWLTYEYHSWVIEPNLRDYRIEDGRLTS